jgi:hypothetical protein
MRMIFPCRREARLFGGEGEGLAAFLNHFTHFAHAFGALGGALVADEDIARTYGAGLDGGGDIPFAQTVAVTDVQGETRPDTENGSL